MKIVYTTETGVCIIHPTGELPIQQVFEKDVPSEYKLTAVMVDDNVIPSDRTFRDAWQLDYIEQGGKFIYTVSENINKVKEIHKERIRAERKVLMSELDGEEYKAKRNSSSVDSIIAEKERLCGLPQLIDACTTLEEIKTIDINTGKI